MYSLRLFDKALVLDVVGDQHKELLLKVTTDRGGFVSLLLSPWQAVKIWEAVKSVYGSAPGFSREIVLEHIQDGFSDPYGFIKLSRDRRGHCIAVGDLKNLIVIWGIPDLDFFILRDALEPLLDKLGWPKYQLRFGDTAQRDFAMGRLFDIANVGEMHSPAGSNMLYVQARVSDPRTFIAPIWRGMCNQFDDPTWGWRLVES